MREAKQKQQIERAESREKMSKYRDLALQSRWLTPFSSFSLLSAPFCPQFLETTRQLPKTISNSPIQ